MPTDEERVEVAKRLRELAADWFIDGEFYDRGEVEDVLGLVTDDGAWYEAAGVRRLADLIDPTVETCELELTWGGQTNAHVRTYECTKCGKSCDNVWGEGYEFCPYCGRRVEYADE